MIGVPVMDVLYVLPYVCNLEPLKSFSPKATLTFSLPGAARTAADLGTAQLSCGSGEHESHTRKIVDRLEL